MPFEDDEFSPLAASALTGAAKYEFEHLHDHGHEHVHDEHDPDNCDECQKEHQEEVDMSMAMTGFAVFGLILFAMWYMLRTCKNKPGSDQFDPSNP